MLLAWESNVSAQTYDAVGAERETMKNAEAYWSVRADTHRYETPH